MTRDEWRRKQQESFENESPWKLGIKFLLWSVLTGYLCWMTYCSGLSIGEKIGSEHERNRRPVEEARAALKLQLEMEQAILKSQQNLKRLEIVEQTELVGKLEKQVDAANKINEFGDPEVEPTSTKKSP